MDRLNVLMPKADDKQEAEYAPEIVAKLKLSTKFVNEKCQPSQVMRLN
jgi:hypothetical protein